ncbi:zinc dependent phospholipase C family protein [Rapidithrix thailandica]|uniref:Zinc dependent phospholipase C family protein n=1 Tax=Rapidithrix thailandica TaxID=413964 RepID=A0AAW9SAB4_9BACT
MNSAIILFVFLSCLNGNLDGFYEAKWGFYAHKTINRMAVFTLPSSMLPFYKNHIQYITENAVNPDARRYVIKQEAPRHYIDIDHYGVDAIYSMPRSWKDAAALYSEDTLYKYGIVPWHVLTMKYRLTKAFQERNTEKILKLSAEIGHYIADANVPLHTTENYNGQLSGQEGIHALWESRLPELYSQKFNFFIGKARYLDHPGDAIWEAVTEAHQALDSVFSFEQTSTKSIGEHNKYSFEDKNGISTKVYSRQFCQLYHQCLNGQVERRMQKAIRLVGDFWYTCWVDAGQPDLDKLDQNTPDSPKIKPIQKGKFPTRSHDF